MNAPHPEYEVQILAGWEVSLDTCSGCGFVLDAHEPVTVVSHRDDEGTERSDVVFCGGCALDVALPAGAA